MWQGAPFFIGEWTKCNRWEAIHDADGDIIPIIGEDVLQASSNFDGLVIHIVLVSFKLT